jgi:beta-phosphoglucomutase-like phosphatase (HAD superfamily)
MQDMGVHPDQSLALEDSDNGARAATDAGLRVIVVPDLKAPSAETRDLALAVLPSLSEVQVFISKV